MNVFPPKPELKPRSAPPEQTLLLVVLFLVIGLGLMNWDLRYTIVLAGVMLMHELGHLIAMNRVGYQDSGVFFLSFLNRYVQAKANRLPGEGERVFVLMAGPLPGVAIGTLLLFLSQYFDIARLQLPALLFLLLNVFNLLPMSPLDGGRLCETLFPRRNILVQSFFTLLIITLLATGIVLSKAWFFLLLPLVLLLQFNNLRQVQQVRRALREAGLNIYQRYESLSDEAYWNIRSIMLSRMPFLRRLLPEGEYSPDQERAVASLLRNMLVPSLSPALGRGAKWLILLLWLLAFFLPLLLISWYSAALIEPENAITS